MEPVPDWLMAVVAAAGRTAFTDEFDCSVLPVGSLSHAGRSPEVPVTRCKALGRAGKYGTDSLFSKGR